MMTRVQEPAGLQTVMQADNPIDGKCFKFNQVLDEILREIVQRELELYKKLTDPQDNEMLKHRRFEGFGQGNGWGLGD